MPILGARHSAHFNPDKMDGAVTVIGCGAIGSRIVQELIRLGVKDISVYDFDDVSEFNIANQAFTIQDIGKHKVHAMQDWAEINEAKIYGRVTEADDSTPITNYLFLCVDSMDVRRDFAERWTRSLNNSLIIETRMSFNEIRIYTLETYEDYKQWIKVSNYTKEETEESVCGYKSSVGPTAGLAAMYAVWQLINHVNDKKVANEIIVSTDPVDQIVNYYHD